jgi:hypothetical protein
MDEYKFIYTIDALFFFETNEEYEFVTRVGCSISDNAALMVGYELASLSSHAPLEVNLNLLEILKNERPSEIIIAAIPVIEGLLRNQEIEKQSIDVLLEACRHHDNPWNGLVVYLLRLVFCFLPSDCAARKEMISSVSIDSISLLLFELPNLASKEV